MVPTTLAAWTIETIERLVAVGIFESRSFDFKEQVARGVDEPGKARLKKTIAAFANESGGFLVFGVKDDRTLPVKDRVVGVAADCDVPAQFGAQAARCTPAVQWTQLNPPHKLVTGNYVHVIEIHEGTSKPHGIFDGERWIFPKRTEGGNELLSYEEIRDAFREQRAVRAALSALRSEAERMSDHAQQLNIELQGGHRRSYIFLMFRPAMFEAALMQVLGRVEFDSTLRYALDNFRGAAHAADSETTRLLTEGGPSRPLIELVLQVLNHGRLLTAALSRLLAQPALPA